MITYLKMKKYEWKVKAIVYGTIVSLIDNQTETLKLFKKLAVALKDVPADKLQKEIVTKLAEIIHEENKDKND